MFRKKFIDRLRDKYQTGGSRIDNTRVLPGIVPKVLNLSENDIQNIQQLAESKKHTGNVDMATKLALGRPSSGAEFIQLRKFMNNPEAFQYKNTISEDNLLELYKQADRTRLISPNYSEKTDAASKRFDRPVEGIQPMSQKEFRNIVDKKQTGGVPASLQNMPRPNIPMPTNQEVIKPKIPSATDNVISATSDFLTKSGIKKYAKKGLVQGAKFLRAGVAAAKPLLGTIALVDPTKDASSMPALYGTGAAGDPTSMNKYSGKVYQKGGAMGSNTLPSAMLPGRAGTGVGSNTMSSAEALTIQRLQEQAEMQKQQEAMDNLASIVGTTKRQMGGAVDLPGGSVEPIPGSDAVEFKGQTHDEGGIMMDPQTEVEDGETMDQVTMAKKGGKRDYFFSSYLKKGGVSFADMHKQILQMGGSQEDIDALAKEQEKAAGRNPDTVKAKHGGAKTLNKVSKELAKASKMHKAQSVKIADLVDHMDKKQGGGFFGEPVNITTLEEQAKLDSEGGYVTPTPAQIEYDRSITMDMLNNPEEYGLDDDIEINEEEENVEDPIVEVYKAQQQQKKDLIDKARKKAARGKGTPTEAYIGMGAQAIPALYAFLHKQKPPQEVSFTKGFTGDVRAGRIKAQKLDRVNYNAERSAADADKRSFDRFIETSGGGPANVINRLAMHSKNLRAKMAITAAETKANTAIANQEAAMAQQAETQNVANALRAAQFSAQMNRAEAARRDQVEAINVAARNKFQADQELNRMNALSALGQGVAGSMGDIMAYKSQERMAEAIGSEGIYQRDIMRNYIARQAQKDGIPGICESGKCTDDQLNEFVANIKF